MARITSDTARLAETLAWAFVDVVWGIFVMLGISVVTVSYTHLVYGVTSGVFDHPVPIAALIGDQQAALFGQTCFRCV